jgi:hypothetical protein
VRKCVRPIPGHPGAKPRVFEPQDVLYLDPGVDPGRHFAAEFKKVSQ